MKKINENSVEFEALFNDLLELNREMFGINHTKEYCQAKLSLLLEEGGELAGEIRSFFGRKYRPEKVSTVEKISGEIGDILNLCFIFCEIFDLDVITVLCNTRKKLLNRYVEHNKNNTEEPNNE